MHHRHCAAATPSAPASPPAPVAPLRRRARRPADRSRTVAPAPAAAHTAACSAGLPPAAATVGVCTMPWRLAMVWAWALDEIR